MEEKERERERELDSNFQCWVFLLFVGSSKAPIFCFFFFCSSIFLVFGVHDYIKFVL